MPRLYRACARPRSSSCTAPSSSGGGDCDDRGECGSATEDVAPVAMKVGSRDRSNGYSFRCACARNGLDRVHNCCVSSVDNKKNHSCFRFDCSLSALSKAGFRVVHVDQNAYYGADEATLSHEELLQWSHSSSSLYSNFFSSSNDPLPFSRSYSLSLAPALIPSAGPLINALILSGVSRYGQFKLLDAVYIYRHDVLERVPGNKEDVFKARNISLVDKRKLMRFLQFASGDFEGQSEIEGQGDKPFGDFMKDKFSLGEEACEAILYALAYCSTLSGELYFS